MALRSGGLPRAGRPLANGRTRRQPSILSIFARTLSPASGQPPCMLQEHVLAVAAALDNVAGDTRNHNSR
jgi:hypothetical protein